jgi:transposase InsO family protein
MQHDPHVPVRERWARFRLQVIGPLLAAPPEPGDLQEALRELAAQVYRHPLRPAESMRVGFSTLERWYYQAKDAPDPLAALARKVRSDAGRRTALTPALAAALEAQYAAYPRWTVQLHYDNLAAECVEHPEWGRLPSYQTVRRTMREKGWARRREPLRASVGQHRAARRRETREIRSYEASHVHGLWHLDFHQASCKVLDASGAWHTPVALAVLDDRSRVCCHLQWYRAETAQCLIHALTQAIAKRGLPRALMTDNGAAMLAEETRQGLARLGVAHETTLPYSAYQNGKQEVFWAQLEGRLLELLRGVEPLRLGFLNTTTQAWVEQDYHRRVHSELGTTPLERLLAGPSVSRPAPELDALRVAFTRQVTRTQRRSDATVVIDGVRFEVPSRFRHLTQLTLRYPAWDRSRMLLIDPDRGTPLAQLLPLDKAQNASGQRRALEPLATPASPAPATGTPLPALVRRWLADYAATGLPPAYLPTEDEQDQPGEEDGHDG